MITIKQLNYALAVDKTRHFKQAAERCSISQSALSTAISELERQLKVQIFERDNKKVLLTPMGEMILRKAHTINLEVSDIYQLCRSQDLPLSYPMSLGIIPTISPYLLPKVLPEVRNQYPDFQLTIIEEQSNVLLEKVKSGDIDAAILALPYATDGLHAFTFWEEDFFVVAHRSDDLAGQREIRAPELRNTPLLLLKEGHCLKDHVLAACKFQPAEMKHSLMGTSLNTLVQMVAGQMGITLVPEMALNQLIYDSAEIKAVHLNEPGPHRKIAFITRLNYAGTRNIEVLMKLFRQQLSKARSGHVVE
ncbi:MAG: hydrogen peroxide-inducible genes activator [Thiotrichaceae bacterium]|nr:hydrogen peroxide-inducible genes activator [Thiotrichaceae bacterium]MBL1260829.1 hydrogen peroxide-inducible genes activator [Thiotrichaceae bacterium]